MKGITPLVAVVILAVAVMGIAAVAWIASLSIRPVTVVEYEGEIACSGLDNADFPSTGYASGKNVTVGNWSDVSQGKTAYFLIDVSGGTIGGLDVEIEKYSGATLPDYVKIKSAYLLDEDGNTLAEFEKDNGDRVLNYNIPLDDDAVIEVNLESYDKPSSNITQAIAWTVDIEADTTGDDDEDTCYILGGYRFAGG